MAAVEHVRFSGGQVGEFRVVSMWTRVGMALPKLYHARELGEPFDFLTWFEFAPHDAARFDDLLGALRESEEWRYVDRELELRLERV